MSTSSHITLHKSFFWGLSLTSFFPSLFLPFGHFVIEACIKFKEQQQGRKEKEFQKIQETRFHVGQLTTLAMAWAFPTKWNVDSTSSQKLPRDFDNPISSLHDLLLPLSKIISLSKYSSIHSINPIPFSFWLIIKSQIVFSFRKSTLGS